MGRVELKITDDRKFQDVALLLDNKKVQTDLEELRKKLKRYITSNRPLGDFLLPAFRLRLATKLALEYKYPQGFGEPGGMDSTVVRQAHHFAHHLYLDRDHNPQHAQDLLLLSFRSLIKSSVIKASFFLFDQPLICFSRLSALILVL